MARRRDKPVGLTIEELAERVGLRPRTITKYVALRLLPPPEPHGRHTRYDRAHLARLLFLRELKFLHGYSRVDDLRSELRRWGDADLIAKMLPEEAAGAPSSASAAPVEGDVRGAWRFCALLPGLALFVADDASDVVQRLAREIEEKYAARAPNGGANAPVG